MEVIATDASKNLDKTTIAGCASSGCFGYIVNQINSVFTAEVLAIGIAIDELVPLACPFMILSIVFLCYLLSRRCPFLPQK